MVRWNRPTHSIFKGLLRPVLHFAAKQVQFCASVLLEASPFAKCGFRSVQRRCWCAHVRRNCFLHKEQLNAPGPPARTPKLFLMYAEIVFCYCTVSRSRRPTHIYTVSLLSLDNQYVFEAPLWKISTFQMMNS